MASRVRIAVMPMTSQELCRALMARSTPTPRGLLAFGRQRKAVIEPGQAAVHVRLVPRRHGLVAHVPRDAFGVIEVPERTRLELHARGAQEPCRLEAAEGSREVAIGGMDQFGEAEPVLDRH